MQKVDKEAANAIRSLVDYVLRHLQVLKSMNLPTDSWDELIVHLIEAKLVRAWELEGRNAADINFLKRKCQMLERIKARDKKKNVALKIESKHKLRAQEKKTALANVTSAEKCYLCQSDHLIYHIIAKNSLQLTSESRRSVNLSFA